MAQLLKFLDDVWNIRWVTGHRTQIAMWCLKLAAGVLTYQTVATSPDLLKAGIDLWDLPATLLLWVSPLPSYFAVKVEQFANEHTPR